MKKLIVPTLVALLFLTGCMGLSVGGGTRTENRPVTIGQQLVDLQKAKEAGAITEAEYQEQKQKVLASK